MFALCLSSALAAVGAWADEATDGGYCGDQLTWAYYADTGELVISGTGGMFDLYTVSEDGVISYEEENVPWLEYLEEIRSLTLEEGVTGIADFAFMSCSELSEVNLPDTLEEIGDYAFYYCDMLAAVEIPESVERIGEWAFGECTALEEVGGIPEDCELSDSAFWQCTGLADEDGFVILQNTLYYYDYDKTYALGGGEYADSGYEVEIPEGVVRIGKMAFRSCPMGSITIPAGVSYLGGGTDGAFEYCSGLTCIYFQGDAPSTGSLDEDLEGSAMAFEHVEATAYYPQDNDTWTEEAMESYGGTITWKSYDPLSKFTDVETDGYYYEALLWAVANGITEGTSSDTFSPLVICTRSQAVTFLYRAAGSPEVETAENPFLDVDEEDYYYEAVLWAVENGITNGTGGDRFSPLETCSRAQIVTFLYRSEGSPEVENEENPFTDLEGEDAYYYEAVLWAVENGITNGTSSVNFSPDASCTRSQIVTFLYRAAELADDDLVDLL